VLERYLANPLFRSARFEELVLDDDPYRRPVRPDDLGMVDFGARLERTDATRLSGLMAHRILLNIHDAHELLLPRTHTAENRASFELFYHPDNIALGDQVRPQLERHVFDFVRDGAREHVRASRADVVDQIHELVDHRDARAAELERVLATSPDPAQLNGMVAIQSVAQALNAELRPAKRLLPLAGSAAIATVLGTPAPGQYRPVRRIAEFGGIKAEPHSYCQYYLPSTLALMNYVNTTFRPGQLFAFAGALVARFAEAQALTTVDLCGGHDPLPSGDLAAAVTELIGEVERVGGAYGLRELSRGLEEYRVLLDVHDDERLRQFRWITTMPYYQEKAERLQAAIETHHIDVDLDTFIESWEECSTTHVHDEDRLLIIESGEMEFWNCFGVQHKYLPGDMAFIPKHSLHGSVVFSGQCVYHQPIITEELDRRFGTVGPE
jgi:hypothetical protein